jgi:curved DNA-binding protein CbpA
MPSQSTVLDLEKAAAVLGVTAPLGESALRGAYLQKVQEHPPDRDPELFEQIRDAYEQLRNPDVRAQAILEGPDPTAPLRTLLDGLQPKRAYVGSQLWMQLLKEKRS